jgi:general secretion pathway protein K
LGSNYSAFPNALQKLMKKPSLNSKLRSGAALMLALWALFLLSAMVVSWAFDINSRLVVSGAATRILEAEAMASSGADVALAREISSDSPNLHRQMGDGESYDVQVTGECGRLNLNLLLAREDLYRPILVNYLEEKGIDLNERDYMIDCLLDWMDPNNLPRLNGAEESEDYHPANTPLTNVDDLKKVKGWAEFTSRPNWQEDFTVVGDCRCIDLAWASRDVLRALDLGDDRVDRFLQLREGSPGLDGTADYVQLGAATTMGSPLSADRKRSSTPGGNACGDVPLEVQSALGLKEDQFERIKDLVMFDGPVSRIVSVGKSGNVSRSVQMIVVKQANNPRVISWKEL